MDKEYKLKVDKLFINNKYLSLTEETKRALSGVNGKVYDGSSFIKLAAKNKGNIITVGDMVTITAINGGIIPNLAIFDMKTERKKINSNIILKAYKKIEVVRNQMGKIDIRLYKSIIKNIDHKKIGIRVIGEEDLATPLCIALSDNKKIIAWGVPGKGINIISVNEKRRKHAYKILEKMAINNHV